MRTARCPRMLRTLVAGAALAAGATAIGAPPPIASAVGPDGTTCFDSSAPPGAGVVVNGTAAAPGGGGFLNFYDPGVSADPTATSSVNYAPGAAVANSVITPVADGEICVYNSATVEIVADVAGWISPERLLVFVDPDDGSPLGAIRVFDTRDGTAGKYRPGEEFCLSPSREPRDDQPWFVNVTIAGAEANGFANIYPQGATSAADANSVINFDAGRNVANGITVSTGTDGRFCIFTSATAHVIIDVVGAVPREDFVPANPDNTADRILNSRNSSPFAAGEERCVDTDAAAGQAVVLNATSFGAQTNGFLNVYSSDATADPAENSTVNFRRGSNVANGTIVPAGEDGRICVFANAATGVIIDVAGYMADGVFVPLNTDGSATRVLDTRTR